MNDGVTKNRKYWEAVRLGLAAKRMKDRVLPNTPQALYYKERWPNAQYRDRYQG